MPEVKSWLYQRFCELCHCFLWNQTFRLLDQIEQVEKSRLPWRFPFFFFLFPRVTSKCKETGFHIHLGFLECVCIVMEVAVAQTKVWNIRNYQIFLMCKYWPVPWLIHNKSNVTGKANVTTYAVYTQSSNASRTHQPCGSCLDGVLEGTGRCTSKSQEYVATPLMQMAHCWNRVTFMFFVSEEMIIRVVQKEIINIWGVLWGCRLIKPHLRFNKEI